MQLDWPDSLDIAIALASKHPQIQPLSLRFTELRDLVMGLPEFIGSVDHCSEAKLEAIQMAWLEEIE